MVFWFFRLSKYGLTCTERCMLVYSAMLDVRRYSDYDANDTVSQYLNLAPVKVRRSGSMVMP